VVEEGAEQGNGFFRDLGTPTRHPLAVPSVPLQLGLGLTDSFPSTFWLTNTANDFIENVAAGLRSSG